MNEDEMTKDNYYFQDKWFETPEEMFKYMYEWRDFPLNQETSERILEQFKKDIVMNVFLLGRTFNNIDFTRYIEKIFEFAIKTLNERDLKGNDG